MTISEDGPVNEMMWKNMLEPDRRMRFIHPITNNTHTHS